MISRSHEIIFRSDEEEAANLQSAQLEAIESRLDEIDAQIAEARAAL